MHSSKWITIVEKCITINRMPNTDTCLWQNNKQATHLISVIDCLATFWCFILCSRAFNIIRWIIAGNVIEVNRDIRFQSVEVGFFDVPSRTSTYHYKSLQTTVRTKSYGEHSEDEDPLPSGEISGLIEILLQFVDGIPLKRLNYLFINDSHRTRQRCFDGHGATGTKTWVSACIILLYYKPHKRNLH